jgi:hypothetical protein
MPSCANSGRTHDPLPDRLQYHRRNVRASRHPRAAARYRRLNVDRRIGILIREGRTIYYAFILGRYVERYTVADLEDCIKVRGASQDS